MLNEVNGPAVNTAVGELFENPSLNGRRNAVASGTVIYDATSAATDVYYIVRGQVRIHQAGPEESGRLVEILGPGDWFGSAALAGAEVHGAEAAAYMPTTLIELPAAKMLETLSQQPTLAAELVRQLAGKLQSERDTAACLVFDDCNSRLIKTLLQFSRSAAATSEEDGVVLHMTHQQLAQAVGAARETVSLALTQLRQQNVVRTGRNKLIFKPEALKALSQRSTRTVEHAGAL